MIKKIKLAEYLAYILSDFRREFVKDYKKRKVIYISVMALYIGLILSTENIFFATLVLGLAINLGTGITRPGHTTSGDWDEDFEDSIVHRFNIPEWEFIDMGLITLLTLKNIGWGEFYPNVAGFLLFVFSLIFLIKYMYRGLVKKRALLKYKRTYFSHVFWFELILLVGLFFPLSERSYKLALLLLWVKLMFKTIYLFTSIVTNVYTGTR